MSHKRTESESIANRIKKKMLISIWKQSFATVLFRRFFVNLPVTSKFQARLNRLLSAAFSRYFFLYTSSNTHNSPIMIPDYLSLTLNYVVPIVEQYADKIISRRQFLNFNFASVTDDPHFNLNYFTQSLLDTAHFVAPSLICENTTNYVRSRCLDNKQPDSSREYMDKYFAIVLDFLGLSYKFNPRWRVNTAVSLATQMYEANNFSAMPILADALQDGDCNNEELLADLRNSDKIWYKGNWIVDKLIGKR